MKNTTKIFSFILLSGIIFGCFSFAFAQSRDDYYDNYYDSYYFHGGVEVANYHANYGYETEDAVQYYTERFTEPAGPDSLYRPAVAAYYIGKNKEADILYEQALKSGSAETYFKFSFWFMNMKEPELFKKHIVRWIKDRPQAKAPYMYQANIYREENKDDKAVEIYNQLISKHPEYGSVYMLAKLPQTLRQKKQPIRRSHLT